MAEWRFLELKDGEVEQELTQRDQFNNDEVELAEALVRESIQNSTDAPSNEEPVKVRFALHDLRGSQAPRLSALFTKLVPHLEACGVATDPLCGDDGRVLVIEDFNTTGLTGAPDCLDESNFRNFWRRHGKSGKSGKALGRWGLGKLVYSSASRISCFFGLTIRDGDDWPLLMGQAVLATHELAGARRPPHGFWFDNETERGLQLPVEDPSIVDPFAKLVGITRSDETGLSLVIPYPHKSITHESLITGVVTNYYFPILAGRLIVEVGDTLIDRDNFLEIAEGVHGLSVPFEFVSTVSERLNSDPDVIGQLPVNLYEVTDQQFPGQLEELRKRLAGGALIHIRLPVDVTARGGQKRPSTFDVFLQNAPAGSDPFALVVRGSLTVPGEGRNFGGAAIWGAMIARDGPVADFLGDAENPAHTHWNATAGKLTANWSGAGTVLRSIRSAPRQLLLLLGEQVEDEDPDALIDFFSLLDDSPTGEARKRRRTRKKPVDITPREKSFQVQPRIGGFVIAAGPGARKWAYPATLRIQVAYDIIGGNPFKRWNQFDFQFTDNELQIDLENATLSSSKGNVFRVTVHGPDFRIEARGFDPNRDIFVEARSV